jgi:hypothetical protein
MESISPSNVHPEADHSILIKKALILLFILRMVGHTCYTIGVLLILFSNEGKHLQKQFHKTVLIHQ